jgi:queuine tRNA-ribosyltransferase
MPPGLTKSYLLNAPLNWAKRCKQNISPTRSTPGRRTRQTAHLWASSRAVDIQIYAKVREALLEIGFDGFGYGGWPFDGQGNLLTEIVALTRELVPPEYPYARVRYRAPFQPGQDLQAWL